MGKLNCDTQLHEDTEKLERTTKWKKKGVRGRYLHLGLGSNPSDPITIIQAPFACYLPFRKACPTSNSKPNIAFFCSSVGCMRIIRKIKVHVDSHEWYLCANCSRVIINTHYFCAQCERCFCLTCTFHMKRDMSLAGTIKGQR